MRPPIRSESDAFTLTVGLSLLIVVSAIVGALAEPIVGFGTFMAAVVIAAVVYPRQLRSKTNAARGG
jgi:hypothetical protein